MKTQIFAVTAFVFLASMLILSTFATSIVSAKRGEDDSSERIKIKSVDQVSISTDDGLPKSVSATDVAEKFTLDASEIEDDLEADSNVPEGWITGPALTSVGTGWATSGSNGYFVKIVYVSKEAMDPNTDVLPSVFVHGRLKISGVGNYRLISEGSSSNTQSMTFQVRKGDEAVGSFTLKTKESLAGNFRIQEGNLQLNNGDVYKVYVATETKAVRKSESKGSGKVVTEAELEKRCGIYSQDSEDYEDCRERAYKASAKIEDNSGKGSWRNFFARFGKSDDSGKN